MDETRVPERPPEEEAFPGVEAETPPKSEKPDYLRPNFVWKEIIILTPREEEIAGYLSVAMVILLWVVMLAPSKAVQAYAGAMMAAAFYALLWMTSLAAIRRGVPHLWRKGERPYRIIAAVTLVVAVWAVAVVISAALDLFRVLLRRFG